MHPVTKQLKPQFWKLHFTAQKWIRTKRQSKESIKIRKCDSFHIQVSNDKRISWGNETGRRKLAAEVWLTEKLISISPVAKFWSCPTRQPACIEMENYDGGSHVVAVREYAWLEEGNMRERLCPFETLKSAEAIWRRKRTFRSNIMTTMNSENVNHLQKISLFLAWIRNSSPNPW